MTEPYTRQYLRVVDDVQYGPLTLRDAVTLMALPTSDPGVAGRLWNSGGMARVSAG